MPGFEPGKAHRIRVPPLSARGQFLAPLGIDGNKKINLFYVQAPLILLLNWASPFSHFFNFSVPRSLRNLGVASNCFVHDGTRPSSSEFPALFGCRLTRGNSRSVYITSLCSIFELPSVKVRFATVNSLSCCLHLMRLSAIFYNGIM